MVKKNFWEKQKSSFGQRARRARKDFAKHTRVGKGSIDSKMGSQIRVKKAF